MSQFSQYNYKFIRRRIKLLSEDEVSKIFNHFAEQGYRAIDVHIEDSMLHITFEQQVLEEAMRILNQDT